MIPFSERKIQTMAELVKAIINTVNCAKSFVRKNFFRLNDSSFNACQCEACNDRYNTEKDIFHVF